MPASVHPHSLAHTRQLPLTAKLPPAPRRQSWPDLTITTRNGLPSAALLPPASSRKGAWDPLGWLTSRPSTTMAHTGLMPAPVLALAPMLFTIQAHPEPHDRGHQKDKQQSQICSAILWQYVAVCREATRPCWTGPYRVNPQPMAAQRSRRRQLGREDAWALHGSAGASRLAGGKQEGGMRGEEKTAHNLRNTQLICHPQGTERSGGSWSQERPAQPSTLETLARPWPWHVSCKWTRQGKPEAMGLSVISSHSLLSMTVPHKEAELERAWLGVRREAAPQSELTDR